MAYELAEIKALRRKFGMTQAELAKRAGVSQSLIAKVEANILDPTYTKAQQIFDALNTLAEKQVVRVAEIMEKKVLAIRPNENVRTAIEKMKKHNISQLPVLERNVCVGLVSEAILLDAVMNQKTGKVKEIMGECPPIVSSKTPVEVVSDLLHVYPTVLVAENGKLAGIVTKSDVIGKIKMK